MKNTLRELYALEQLSGGSTCVHRIHPAAKLLATAVFIITAVSFDRYSFGRLVPYVFFPTLLMAFSETPYAMLLKRFLIALPFCLFAGAANVLFDRAPAFTAGGVTISYGVVSLFTILLRVYLCVMAVLVLVAVTPLSEMVHSMRRLKIPHVFVIVFEMTYRYIGVLFEEAYSMYTAYTMRSPNAKGIRMRDMGSFTGQILVRSVDRADRVYTAMKCRGYALQTLPKNGRKPAAGDVVFLAVTCFLCVLFRVVNINTLFAGIFGGRT
jgi:cobalt/nickel transport system permease protein